MQNPVEEPKRHLVSQASTSQVVNYGYAYSQKCKFSTKHGDEYAAVWTNNLVDTLRLKDAYIIGRKQSKRGPNRVVDGYKIQTKYFSNFDSLYDKCFKHKKEFRFAQQIVEVPPEQYDKMIQQFESHGISSRQLKKGSASFKDTVKARKFMSLRGIYFDFLEGVLTEIVPCFIHGSIIFIQYRYFKERSSQESSLKAIEKVTKSFCVRTISNLLAQQVGRLNLKLLHSTVKVFFVNLFMNKHNCKHFLTAFRPRHEHFKHVRGEVAKILTGQMLYSAALISIILAGDIIKYKRKRMTKKQFTKNLVCEIIGATSGLIGQTYGFCKKSYALGSILGLVSGMLAYSITKSVANAIIKDDYQEMMILFEKVLKNIISQPGEYNLDLSQKNNFISFMSSNNSLTYDFFEEMIKESNKEELVRRLVYSQLPKFKNPDVLEKTKKSFISRFLGLFDI